MFKFKVQMSDGISLEVEASNNYAHAMKVAERKMQGKAFGSRAIYAEVL